MKLKILPSVDSTNNYLRHLADNKKVEEGTSVVSLEQISGRGQRGNSWVSEAGMGLYFSILLRPATNLSDEQFTLNKVVAASSARYLESVCGCRVLIRWPNDLLVGGRKAGGILIENSWRGGRLTEVIAGIGINLNQQLFQGIFQTPPVSVFQLTGKHYDPVTEAAALGSQVFSDYESWQRGAAAEVVEYYSAHLYGRGGKVRFMKAGGDFVEAYFSGVDDMGRAVIIENGVEKRVSHPEYRIHAISVS